MSAPICAPCQRGGDNHDHCLGVVRIGRAAAMCRCEECRCLAMEKQAQADEERAAW